MSKFNVSTAQGGGGSQTIAPNAVEELKSDIPVGVQQTSMGGDGNVAIEVTPEQIDSDLIAAMNTAREERPAVAQEETPISMEAEADRQGRDSMRERFADETGGRWQRKEIIKGKDDDGHGGIFSRANAFVKNVTNENIGMSSFMKEGSTDGLPYVLRRAGGVLDLPGKAEYNADFLAAMSIVTENWMADQFAMQKRKDLKEGLIKTADVEGEGEPPIAGSTFGKLQGNERLGQEISREFQRIQGARETTDVLTPDEATLLGDAAKEMFAVANPDLVQRQVTPGKQTEFVLTPQGADAMTKTERTRKRLFPKQDVRPATQPLPSGKLPGEAKNYTKSITGEIKPRADSAMIEEAKRNAASVANVVDRQREKILYMTALPILQAGPKFDDPSLALFSEINNVGPSKMQALVAKEKAKQADGDLDFSAYGVMDNMHNKMAEEVRSIANERGGARYFTYYTMAYNGRISPQQTTFDATSAKNVRFVTRAAVPSVARKGNRIDNNLKQMYAMMLVSKGTSRITIDGKAQAADMLLPKQRLRALENATPQLLKWGRRLRHLVENGMTDSQLDAVAEAIQRGEKLTITGPDGTQVPNPNFPQFTGLQLDPEADAELIKEIKAKGEDGMHFIDGLIDFSKYHHAMETKGVYESYFNAYFDGKTNGLAANGIQMGSLPVALRTGVVRYNDQMLLDDGDLRDELAKVLVEEITNQTNGIQGIPEGMSEEFYTVAHAVFTHRDLNKWSTMTFGYGLDISSMAPAIEESAAVIYEKMLADPSSAEAKEYIAAYERIRNNINEPVIGDILLPTYSSGVVSVLSEEAVKSRALMKMAAAIAGFNDQVFTIMGPHGMPLHYGGSMFDEGADPISRQSYVIKQDGKSTKRTADTYPAPKKTAAATRNDTIGGKAMGGAIPGPIQATDAATVASLLSGKSWERMKSASNGKPYVHTIYDAFKVDARGYDVALEEVNNNWYNINMKWSYLKEAKKSVDKNMEGIIKKMRSLENNKMYDLTDFPMLDSLIKFELNDYGYYTPKNLIKFIKSTMDADPKLTPEEHHEKAVDISKSMVKVFADSGIKPEGEYEQLTGKQIKDAMRVILKQANIQARMTKMIQKNEADKKKLDAEIKRLGVPNYQYYAH